MKPRAASIVFIIFFLAVQSQYFWEQNLGLVGFFIIMGSFYFFCILGIVWIYHLVKLRNQENRTYSRVITILLGLVVITSTYLKPFGIIDFQQFESKTVLEARKEGGGGCNILLKLYEDYTFKESESCFGASTTKGEWHIKNDTFYFGKVRNGTRVDEYYEKGIIEKRKYDNSIEYLRRYLNSSDSIGMRIRVTKNKLISN